VLVGAVMASGASGSLALESGNLIASMIHQTLMIRLITYIWFAVNYFNSPL
jgi:hypothetical protein